jgi:hypothetical protein
MNTSDISFFTADCPPPYGITYGGWTVRWWQWALSIPKSKNPVLDRTGEYACENQPPKDVWFLAGKLAEENRNPNIRSCKIPTGRSILFPVINCEANSLELPELRTELDIIQYIEKEEDAIVLKECYVDGNLTPAQRIKSDPIIFDLNMVNHNLFTEKGGNTRASADGYWVFLKPPPKGEHTISFHGSCTKGKRNSGAIYYLQVCQHHEITI